MVPYRELVREEQRRMRVVLGLKHQLLVGRRRKVEMLGALKDWRV